ncbi:MAG: hypothetical protein II249_03300 [Bacteroidaceae bacterium]|nr:hypothetical protein [Bacteroidaceae bacterium]
MAFSRKALKAMGITDEQIESIIELHTESIDAIKADRDKYKEDAEKLSDVQRQLDEANSKIEAAKKDDYKGKYESEKAAHDKLKEDIKVKETTAKKSTALKAYLKEKGYSDNGITKITKYGDYIKDIELDEDGKIKDADKLIGKVETEWSEYKPQAGTSTFKPNVPTGAQSSKPTSEIASRFKQLDAKYNYDHYGVKAEKSGSTGDSSTKEE